MRTVKAFLFLIFTAPLWAAQDSKEIKFKSRDLEKIKAEISDKQQEKERLKKEEEELRRAVKQSEEKIKDVQTSLMYTKQKSTDIERQMASTKNRHDSLAGNLSQQKAGLKDTVQTYYVASLLNSPSGMTPVYTKQIIRAQIQEIRKSSAETELEQKNYQSLIETQQVIRNEVVKQEGKLSSIRSGREDKERLLNKKKTQQEVLEAEVRDLQRTAEEVASLIDALRTKAKDEKTAEKQARIQKQISGPSPIASHSLPWPVEGKVITRFGRQQMPNLSSTFVSNGIVLSVASIQSVSAVADGKVLYAGDFMSYGSMVVVEHAGDWYTVYGRLSKWVVEKGQDIKKGDSIGFSRPRSGGGYETYFELRFYGKPTDPLPWLK